MQKIGYFQILISGLELYISGTLQYNVCLVLFSEKKSKLGMKNEIQILKKKPMNFIVSRFFLKYKIIQDSTMRPINVYLAMPKVYFK
jgi:hypothetical protein